MTIPSRHLGDTRSGKKICLYDTSDQDYIRSQTTDFDGHDYFDAYCLFQYFTVRAIRQYGQLADEVRLMTLMGNYHYRCIDSSFFDNEKKSLSLITSIDLKNHGESLVKDFLRA